MEYTGKSYLSASNIELLECLDLHKNNIIVAKISQKSIKANIW